MSSETSRRQLVLLDSSDVKFETQSSDSNLSQSLACAASSPVSRNELHSNSLHSHADVQHVSHSTMTQHHHNDHDEPVAYQQAPDTKCVVCAARIVDKYLMQVASGSYAHESCLQCAACRAPLETHCYVRDAKLYCQADYLSLFAVKCKRCVRPLKARDLVVRLDVSLAYHATCMACALCSKQLTTGDKCMLLKNGAVLCERHTSNTLQQQHEHQQQHGKLQETSNLIKLTSVNSQQYLADASEELCRGAQSNQAASNASASNNCQINNDENNDIDNDTEDDNDDNAADDTDDDDDADDIIRHSDELDQDNYQDINEQQSNAVQRVKTSVELRKLRRKQQRQGSPVKRCKLGATTELTECGVMRATTGQSILHLKQQQQRTSQRSSNSSSCSSPSSNLGQQQQQHGSGRRPSAIASAGAGHGGQKPTRIRTVLNEQQLQTLRDCYAHNPRPDAVLKEQLVEATKLNPRVIRVWFQVS